MRILLLGALAALLIVPAALAAKAPTQKQYTEQKLKTAMMTSSQLKGLGLKWGTVTCVLPKNGNIVHCTVHASAPAARENIVFKVKETLKETGAMSWAITSDACSDSKTGQKLACSG
jgi:L-aminopeptidase/D-esterase-like protein